MFYAMCLYTSIPRSFTLVYLVLVSLCDESFHRVNSCFKSIHPSKLSSKYVLIQKETLSVTVLQSTSRLYIVKTNLKIEAVQIANVLS